MIIQAIVNILAIIEFAWLIAATRFCWELDDRIKKLEERQ